MKNRLLFFIYMLACAGQANAALQPQVESDVIAEAAKTANITEAANRAEASEVFLNGNIFSERVRVDFGHSPLEIQPVAIHNYYSPNHNSSNYSPRLIEPTKDDGEGSAADAVRPTDGKQICGEQSQTERADKAVEMTKAVEVEKAGKGGVGLLHYRNFWELNEVQLMVCGKLIEGTPIFVEDDTVRIVNAKHSYFVPLDKIEFIRTDDGLETPFENCSKS